MTGSGDAAICTLGVLAFGDSITNGGGELQWGVALQSWALWVARALGVPFTNFAADGATVGDVVERQIVDHRTRSATPDARYELGCLFIGVNDVRGFDWEPRAFADGFARALAYLEERAERVLALTIPLDLGRPRAGSKVEGANRIIERAATAAGALVVDLRGFRGRRVVMADHVHPTAFGQIAIAERALSVLAADGRPPRIAPSALVSYETTRIGRLRGDATYAYRHAKVTARSLALQALLRAGAVRPTLTR